MNAPHIHTPSKPWVLQAGAVLAISVLVSIVSSFLTSNYLNDKVKQQGENGLQLFYTQSLQQCRLTRQNTLKLKDGFAQLGAFSTGLINSLKLQQKGALSVANDKTQTPAVRKAANARALGYQKFIDTLPVPQVIPEPPMCIDIVKSPQELAQQVRNKPGKSTTTTTPVKGKK